MTATLAIIAVPSILLALVLEVREGRLDTTIATADGGIAIGVAAIACHAAGVI